MPRHGRLDAPFVLHHMIILGVEQNGPDRADHVQGLGGHPVDEGQPEA